MPANPQVTDEMVEKAALAMERGVCSTCGVPAVGDGGGYTDCGCAHPNWREATNKEKARAALEAALADHVVGWRDIESAPKDGTWILLYDPIHAGPVIAKYKYSALPPGKYGRFIWHLQEDGGSLAEQSVPHWMPLPAAPLSQKNREDAGT